MDLQTVTRMALSDLSSESRSRAAASSNSSRYNMDAVKRLFMRVAVSICPEFIVREEMKSTLCDLVNWCVMDYSGRLDPDRGLWLWGTIGTGKSTLLRILRRFCPYVRPRDKCSPYGYDISSAINVCAAYQRAGYEGLENYITNPYHAFDELGAETIPTSYYGGGENVLQHVLQQRYNRRRSGFTHVTTNLMPQQIASVYGERVFDRCKEMFTFVEIKGRTFRHFYCPEGNAQGASEK